MYVIKQYLTNLEKNIMRQKSLLYEKLCDNHLKL